MPAVLDASLPFFALVGCGWLAARLGLFPLSALPGLNVFTLYFALPALLLRLGASGTLLAGARLVPALAYASAGLCIVALVWRLERRGRAPRSRLDAGFAALVTAFPNSGFMGLPLLIGLLGPGAAGPIACTLLVDVFLISSLCLALSQEPDAAHRLPQRLLGGLRSALANPLPWSIAAGVLAGEMGLRPGGAAAHFVQLLGDAATPVALFALGAMLERARAAGPAPRVAAGIAPLVAIKLALHPALVLGFALAWSALGAGVAAPGNPPVDLATAALVLTAALPCAGNVSLLAERFGADTARVAKAIVWSTVIALGSFTAWASALRASSG